MGTRHHQRVIDKQGVTKVSQYGQWDGYTEGQGKNILNFLRNADLETYQKNLNNLSEATQEYYDRINKFAEEVRVKKLGWDEERMELQNNPEYYALSRDCGSNIHNLILGNKIKGVQFTEYEEALKWCEGFYTIDFSTNKFTVEYHGIVKEYDLNNLPTEEQFLKDFEND